MGQVHARPRASGPGFSGLVRQAQFVVFNPPGGPSA